MLAIGADAFDGDDFSQLAQEVVLVFVEILARFRHGSRLLHIYGVSPVIMPRGALAGEHALIASGKLNGFFPFFLVGEPNLPCERRTLTVFLRPVLDRAWRHGWDAFLCSL